MASRTLLIDADIFVYQAATSAEIEIEWAEDEWTLHAHASPAKEWIREKFEKLADELKAESWVAALSDVGSFRKEVVSIAQVRPLQGHHKYQQPLCLNHTPSMSPKSPWLYPSEASTDHKFKQLFELATTLWRTRP